MLERIVRYTISEKVGSEVKMPQGAEVLSVGTVGPDLCMWVRIPDAEGEIEDRVFFAVSEHQQFEGSGAKLVGNCADSFGLNLHVFERLPGHETTNNPR